MTEKFKILAKFIKDASSETADVETYLFVKENISKYQLNIDINSKALKNKLIEVNITMKFEDKEPNEKKSFYEIIYTTVIKVDEDIKEKKDMINKLSIKEITNLPYLNTKLSKKKIYDYCLKLKNEN